MGARGIEGGQNPKVIGHRSFASLQTAFTHRVVQKFFESSLSPPTLLRSFPDSLPFLLSSLFSPHVSCVLVKCGRSPYLSIISDLFTSSSSPGSPRTLHCTLFPSITATQPPSRRVVSYLLYCLLLPRSTFPWLPSFFHLCVYPLADPHDSLLVVTDPLILGIAFPSYTVRVNSWYNTI